MSDWNAKVAQNGSQGHSGHVLRRARLPRGKHRGRRIKQWWRALTFKARGHRARKAS